MGCCVLGLLFVCFWLRRRQRLEQLAHTVRGTALGLVEEDQIARSAHQVTRGVTVTVRLLNPREHRVFAIRGRAVTRVVAVAREGAKHVRGTRQL
jgi:hypothetical protein